MSKIKLPNSIKMVITDFDGVVPDNCVYINEDFTMSRKLNFKDVMGFSVLKKNGFDVAIISGEANPAITVLSEKFDIKEVHQKIRIKIDVLKAIIEKYNLTQEEYLYIGDDINDLECLNYAKYRITVPHAVEKVKAVDTTGAGDGFIGSFLYQLYANGINVQNIESLTEEQMNKFLAYSNRFCAYSVQRKGAIASYPTSQEVEF